MSLWYHVLSTSHNIKKYISFAQIRRLKMASSLLSLNRPWYVSSCLWQVLLSISNEYEWSHFLLAQLRRSDAIQRKISFQFSTLTSVIPCLFEYWQSRCKVIPEGGEIPTWHEVNFLSCYDVTWCSPTLKHFKPAVSLCTQYFHYLIRWVVWKITYKVDRNTPTLSPRDTMCFRL